MSVVTRFAPSPTGFLHIGGARTALFNWLFARHHGGIFQLRIEDTDRARSTEEAKAAILDGLSWLELTWDGDVVFQSERARRHSEAAQELLRSGHAYNCYASPAELAEMRERAKVEGRPATYDRRWRDRDPAEAPEGVSPAVRFKAPNGGTTTIDDGVQGSVEIDNQQLDDMVLLRADGSPTYMLSVVVDDHDMGITDVIRGDDHLTNAFRQTQLYRALGWEPPRFVHIPLIHGSDGAKLSKRHGALGVAAYREMGYLPEAICNYLLRLGWAHGDDEIIDREHAIAWFDLDGVGKSAARFDLAKLENLNGHYLRDADNARLIALMDPHLFDGSDEGPTESDRKRLMGALPGLKKRAKTIVELAENARFYVAKRPIGISGKAALLLTDEARILIADFAAQLSVFEDWSEASLEAEARAFASSRKLGLGKLAQPLRAALTGATASPSIFEVMAILGRDECLARFDDIAA
ncbi:MAG: glutamate--tRNA ligase [Alphaproteobacteria bacterium]|nr:glutamate--tRNA ligase [Alphaproteobacteria bacterium]